MARRSEASHGGIYGSGCKSGAVDVWSVDVTLYELAGPHCDQLRWEAGNRIYTMESNTFRRILYDRLGQLFMSYQMNIECSFPWLIGYTCDVYRDAPSQGRSV